jgi:hypothetical protein
VAFDTLTAPFLTIGGAAESRGSHGSHRSSPQPKVSPRCRITFVLCLLRAYLHTHCAHRNYRKVVIAFADHRPVSVSIFQQFQDISSRPALDRPCTAPVDGASHCPCQCDSGDSHYGSNAMTLSRHRYNTLELATYYITPTQSVCCWSKGYRSKNLNVCKPSESCFTIEEISFGFSNW